MSKSSFNRRKRELSSVLVHLLAVNLFYHIGEKRAIAIEEERRNG